MFVAVYPSSGLDSLMYFTSALTWTKRVAAALKRYVESAAPPSVAVTPMSRFASSALTSRFEVTLKPRIGWFHTSYELVRSSANACFISPR